MNSLPIDAMIPQILQALQTQGSLILTAAPGAGKTTRLPPALFSLTEKQVWVLEPRRVAAVAAAHRIAEERQWSVGEEVGYQVRFENKTSQQTRLVFLTEALLVRKALQDSSLRDVGIVVLDEFHERSIHVDLALGLLKELQMLSRPDLKIVVMSATINVTALSQYFNYCAVVEVPGKLFPLQLVKAKASQLLRTDFRFIDRVVETIKNHVARVPSGKDILVFLPGHSEISRTLKALMPWSEDLGLAVFPLTGTIALADQLAALRPSAKRKIILATNVAESSVTVDGVDTVIDSGLVRVLRQRPGSEVEQLTISRISKASAQQRAGRAARQFPGVCLQLWTQQDELSMAEFEIAEIQRIDLMETVLFLKKWGVQDLPSFAWYEQPPAAAVQSAESGLQKIGAIADGRITSHGQRLAEVPLAPRLAQILLVAHKLGASDLGRDICALLQERDLKMSGGHFSDCDLAERLDCLDAFRKSGESDGQRRTFQAIERTAQQLRRYTSSVSASGIDRSVAIAEILLLSFPDRLCRRRTNGSRKALAVGGRGVELSEDSAVKKAEFFIALDLRELESAVDVQVQRATPVTKVSIEKHFGNCIERNSRVFFDEENKNFYVEDILTLWGLWLEEPRRRLAKIQDIEQHLPQIMVQRWSQVLKENEMLSEWWQRWEYFQQQAGLGEVWTEKNKLEVFKLACYGENQWSAVIKKDLLYYFENNLAPELVRDFSRKCPGKLEVPTGNKIRIHYHLDKPPHLEVRLQELFGMSKTPTIWEGQVAVTLHLLGPNYRPVQMTSDLASFWKNTYQEVRKELRTRYPKHSWPEDPLTAPPVARGRSKR